MFLPENPGVSFRVRGERERVNSMNVLEKKEMTALSFPGIPQAGIEACTVTVKVRGFLLPLRAES